MINKMSGGLSKVLLFLTTVHIFLKDADGACSHLGDIQYGKVVPRGSRAEGSTVRYSCDDGYELIGDAYRTCRNSQWTGTAARCQKRNCGDPGTPLNGIRHGTDFTYQRTVLYTCKKGYTMYGRNIRKCGADGMWDGILPACFRTTCSMPPQLQGGCLTVPFYPVYEDTANYTCNTRFHLEGAKTRTCLFTGEWDAPPPTCKPITCPRLAKPDHGKVTLDTLGHKASFSCDDGYQLTGPTEITCDGAGPRGSWSATAPSCKPVNCSEVDNPDNGLRLGGSFVYPSVIKFQCYPGHFLQGSASMQCQADQTWSATRPRCTACPKNTYKPASNDQRSCTPCPAHSHTATEGSSQIVQCQCETGYTRRGNTCIEIQCPRLSTPPHATAVLGQACSTKRGGVCSFTCNHGYEATSGDTRRTCQATGRWTGSQLSCTACQKDTYKGPGDSKCKRCPEHTHTPREGSTHCVCDAGWTGPPGGACVDVNECATNKGGCEQKCENNPGSYSCICDVPGYKQSKTDFRKCEAENLCPAFPDPDFGGSTCLMIHDSNTKRCQVVCNEGYEHADRVNSFEQCGPSTGWKWTLKTNHVCMEMAFAGITLETEIYYFVDDCLKLTNEQKQKIREAFLKKMYANDVCLRGNVDLCNVDNIEVSCGETPAVLWEDDTLSLRRKRSTDTMMLKIKFSFVMPEVTLKNVSCSSFCHGNVSEACRTKCYQSFHNKSLKDMTESFTKFKNVLERNDTGMMGRPGKGGSRNQTVGFDLNVDGIFMKPMKVMKKPTSQLTCSTGSIPKDTPGVQQCFPCPPGTFAKHNLCNPCPIGYHQPLARQTRCRRCPPRSTSSKPGAATCTIIRKQQLVTLNFRVNPDRPTSSPSRK